MISLVSNCIQIDPYAAPLSLPLLPVAHHENRTTNAAVYDGDDDHGGNDYLRRASVVLFLHVGCVCRLQPVY